MSMKLVPAMQFYNANNCCHFNTFNNVYRMSKKIVPFFLHFDNNGDKNHAKVSPSFIFDRGGFY